ncbi:DUF2490 domain-containing protein [Maribacter sp. HTCC2170]|uniref:DUF2490 domain-containing protein n=1 Tax=Maribacter sp. (strain HTCC2170 / KCCM 42371) TaxID=313603 RepID=UPI00006AFCA3|nr:DUF2490 domain-containing protein [Maribacter sp. HTCC2170]EAR01338.1 hypothetical protein FB2170_11476 [Maribacter sp. HTCC2170]
MKFSNTIILLILAIFVTNISVGQEANDVAFWSSIKIGYEPNKDWEFALEGQLRLKEDISELDEYFPELTVTRKLVKGLKLGLGARYVFFNDNRGSIQGTENHFRFHTDLSYKHDIHDLTLRYRIRYQNKNELGVSEADGDIPIQRVRLKLGVEYNIPNWKLDPEIAGEIFSRFKKGEESEFDKYRITLSTSYKIKRAGKIGAFYRLERDIQSIDRWSIYIIGLKYGYTFD